ncbi:MAG: AAA family ATPase [Planctomycetota bacterium]|nr:AAA family ATPase [Planctomycetota bacterium]
MLTSLEVANFRVFSEPVVIRFRPITVLIGRNSAGKSTLVKFLLMLQQSLDVTQRQFLVSDGPRVKLGEFSELRNSLRGDVSLRFRLHFTTSDLPEERQLLLLKAAKNVRPRIDPYTDESQFTFSVPAHAGQAAIQEQTADVELKGQVSYSPRGQYGIHQVVVTLGNTKVHEDFGRLRNPDVRLLQFPARSTEPHHTVARILADRFLTPIRYELSSIRHLEAVREESTRVIVTATPPEDDVGQRGQFAMPQLQRLLLENGDGADFVRRHLARIADVEDIRFESTMRGYIANAKAVNRCTKAESHLSDFGFGVGQCLPVIVQGGIAPRGHLVMVEQPEAQLHPTAQLEMGDFLAELWMKRGVHSLIETHSANIILRLRALISEGKLTAEDLSIAYLYTDEEGTPRVKNLRVSEDGKLEPGLPMEFFGADVIDSMRIGAKRE